MKEFINSFFDTKIVLLKDTNIKLFKSAQVNLKNIDDNIEYLEISAGNLSMQEKRPVRKIGANPVSLNNQKLQIGDVLISARSKLSRVRIIRAHDISRNIPTVAMKGIIIIRTENENLGFFIKYFLELPEVKDYINNDSSSLDKNGKRKIDMDFLLSLPFPDILNSDFSMFTKYKEYYSDIERIAFTSNRRIANARNIQLANSYKLNLNDETSYNVDKWKKIENLYEQINNIIDDLEKS